MKIIKILFSLSFILLFTVSCNKEKDVKHKETNQSVKYAKGFSISHADNYTKIEITAPFQGADKAISFYVYKQGAEIKKEHKKTDYIQLPLQRFIPTSTTHIPMIELLNSEKKIVGFPDTKYVSSKKTRALIDSNKIIDIGGEQQINTEILLDLNPQLMIAFSVKGNHRNFDIIQKMGVPIIYNGDWLEPTPLGKAEWIKFFGVLLDQEKRADSIFNQIEKNYLAAKKLVKNTKHQKRVLSGGPFKDIWNNPRGESYEAQFLKDANLDYVFKHTKGSGSLSYNVEQVFEQAKDIDIWLTPSFYNSMEILGNGNGIFKEFDAYKKNQVYSFVNTKGATGGLIYYELAATRPDYVLKDLIKIGYPDLLPNYKMHFYKQLK